MRRVERKESRIEFLESAAAARATHLRAHDREAIFRVEQMRGAAADLERALHQIARFKDAFRINHPDDGVDRVFLEALEFAKLRDRDQLAIDVERVKALSLGPARHFGVKTFARLDQRREHLERTAPRCCFHLPNDRGDALFFHRQIAVRAILSARLGEEEPEKMVNLGDRGDGRFSAAARDPLFDRDGRRKTFDQIDVRLFQLLDELPRVGRHAVEKAALSFGKEEIEGDG